MVLSADCNDYNVYTLDENEEAEDVIINHQQETYCPMFRLSCSKSFLDVCKELGLDKSKNAHISI